MDLTNISLGANVIDFGATFVALGIVYIIVTVILKGLALYKAARLQEKIWFWIMLILNTSGVLPAIYLYLKRKK